MRIVMIVLAAALVLSACTRREGRFNTSGYEVIEVRPGLTCVFVNGQDGGVSCVPGTFPRG